MTINRTTRWPFFVAVFLLGLLGLTPSHAFHTIAARVVVGGLNSSYQTKPSAQVQTSARIKGTPVPPSHSATLLGKQSERTGMGSASPSGSQDDPYTNYRFADHYLRSATVLIVALPAHPPYLRLRAGANPSSPRDPPFFLI
jgi:hypothetical protein